MPRTIRTKVYKFDELSKQAQQKAIDIYRDEHAGDENPNEGEIIDSFQAFCRVFDGIIDVYDWSAGGRGEGVFFRFTGSYADEIENLSGQRLATYIWNNFKRDLFKGKYYSLWSKTEKSYKYHKEGFPVLKSRHSKVIIEGRNCVLTGVCYDDDMLYIIYDFLDKPDNRNFRDLLEDCFSAFLKTFNDEREYMSTDEYIKEEIENREMLFTKDGLQFNH